MGAALFSPFADNPNGDGRDTVQESFELFVDSVAVADLSDPALLRWELHVARVGGSLGRILAIGRRIEDLGPTAELRAVMVNAAFVQTHPSSKSMDFFTTPSAVDPLIHAPKWRTSPFAELITYMLATRVEKIGDLDWKEPTTFPSAALEAPRCFALAGNWSAAPQLAHQTPDASARLSQAVPAHFASRPSGSRTPGRARARCAE